MPDHDGFGDSIERAMQQLDEIAEAVNEAQPAAVEAGVKVLLPAAIEFAPERTGQLKSTGRDEPLESGAGSASHHVYFLWFYAGFLEFGTVKMPAQPFLRPAADLRQQEIFEAIKGEIGKHVDIALLHFRDLRQHRE